MSASRIMRQAVRASAGGLLVMAGGSLQRVCGFKWCVAWSIGAVVCSAPCTLMSAADAWRHTTLQRSTALLAAASAYYLGGVAVCAPWALVAVAQGGSLLACGLVVAAWWMLSVSLTLRLRTVAREMGCRLEPMPLSCCVVRPLYPAEYQRLLIEQRSWQSLSLLQKLGRRVGFGP